MPTKHDANNDKFGITLVQCTGCGAWVDTKITDDTLKCVGCQVERELDEQQRFIEIDVLKFERRLEIHEDHVEAHRKFRRGEKVEEW